MTARRRDEGVPSLRNRDVTGMTEPKQEQVIRESGTTPDRGEAAEEFLDEQHDQARSTDRPQRRQGNTGMAETSGESHPGVTAEGQTELEKHWDPKTSTKR
jgi:hypothetical protein